MDLSQKKVQHRVRNVKDSMMEKIEQALAKAWVEYQKEATCDWLEFLRACSDAFQPVVGESMNIEIIMTVLIHGCNIWNNRLFDPILGKNLDEQLNIPQPWPFNYLQWYECNGRNVHVHY